ncbi:L-tryptophan--pyruvate aminotransferase 1, partial [Linum perenne]
VFEPYWRKNGDKCTITISGHESLSYFSDSTSVCWYMEPKLQDAIRRIHRVVGNAETDDRHLVVGTGSTLLFQAALHALAGPAAAGAGGKPVDVVCAAPYYSQYKEQVEMLQSRLYEWGGDALTYSKNGPYIEVVTTPNNPDGSLREAVVDREDGMLIHDLAYYWPSNTPITHVADHDIMLFTLTKCSGHAGSRIGWAIVKDKEVAKRMTMFKQVCTIGVSKDSQVRAAKILNVIADDCENHDISSDENFFGQNRKEMEERWIKLKEAIRVQDTFTLPKYPQQYCNFSKKFFHPTPAFGWLKCKNRCDASTLLKEHNVLTRGGQAFGASTEYTRISMIGTKDDFDRFVERVSKIRYSDDDRGVLVSTGHVKNCDVIDDNEVDGKSNANGNGIKGNEANGNGNGIKGNEANGNGNGIKGNEANGNGNGIKGNEANANGNGIKGNEANANGNGIKGNEANGNGNGIKGNEANANGNGIKGNEANANGNGIKGNEANGNGNGFK